MNKETKAPTTQSSEAQTDKKSKKSFKIILPLALVLTAGIIAAIVLTLPKKEKRTISVSGDYDKDVLVPTHVDGKFGYIDLGGNMIIEPKFDYATVFRNNKYAVAYVDDFSRRVIINRNGDIVRDSKDEVLWYYDKLDLWLLDDDIYDGDLNFIGKSAYDNNFDLIILQKDGDPQNHYTAYVPGKKEAYTIDTNNTDLQITGEVNTPSGQKYCALTTTPDDPNTTDIDETISKIINCNTGETILDNINQRLSDDHNVAFIFNDYKTTHGYYIVNNNQVVAREEALSDNSSEFEFATVMNSPTVGYYIEATLGKVDSYTGEEVATENYYIYSTNEFTETKPQTFADLNPGYHDSENPLGLDILNENYIVIENDEGRQGLRKGNEIIIDCDYDSISFYSNWKREDNDLVAANKDQTLSILDANTGEVIATLTNKEYVGYSTDIRTFIYEKNGDYYHIINPETRKQATIYSPSKSTLKYVDWISYSSDWIRIYNAETDNYDYYNKNLELFYYEDYYNEERIYKKMYENS